MCVTEDINCKWRLFTIFMAAITVSITGFLITPGYIYKHYPLVGFYHVISHLGEGVKPWKKEKVWMFPFSSCVGKKLVEE